MKFRPKQVTGSTWFRTVVGLFVAANLWSLLHRPECCDQLDGIGIPIVFHLSGGTDGTSSFYFFALLLDVAIALTAAIIAVRIELAIKHARQQD